MKYAIYAMIYLGSALMIYNIYGFIRFARKIQAGVKWDKGKSILHIPITLLVLFFLGYLAVGIFGKPDLIVSGILFGGSIFVFVMYRLLDIITSRIFETEKLRSELLASEKSNKAKTEFLSGLSHEMRTPLNMILGLDTMALSDGDISDKTKERLEKIGSSAKHLLGIINNILDLSSIETGEFVLKSEEFTLGEAVGQVSEITKALCSEKGLTYTCTGSFDADARYIGDETRLNQVLLAMLDNAVKYTEAPGQVSLEAELVGSDGDTDSIRFTVKDTGVGIGPDFLPKVFEVFTKEDASATSSHGGSGIGLAVAKSITEKFGGKISAESEKNVGSTFTVVIPLERAQETAGDGDAPEASLNGRHILIAEDIPENAEIVADLLELEGATSEHAPNGQIAYEMFLASPENHFDAILMDLRMPVADGLAATRMIRSADRADAGTVPIIALSANAFESDVRESLAAGMNAHIAKPTDADNLYSILRKWLR